MKTLWYILTGAAALAFTTGICGAQCSTSMLVALDEERNTFNVSIQTNDVHCLAAGTVHYQTNPPQAALFEREEKEWWGCGTIIDGPPGLLRNPIMAINMPPGLPFQLLAQVMFDDPAYPPQMREEMVWINPANGMLEIYRPFPCMANVPPVIGYGSYCFLVCHDVYRILLMTPPPGGQPVIRVAPGCEPLTGCVPPAPCTPGNPSDYIQFVYQEAGQWWLYFEYSNPTNEPVCYCVTYEGNLPPTYQIHNLIAFDEETQSLMVSLTPGGEYDGCAEMEIFSYPPGLYIGESASPLRTPISIGPAGYRLNTPVAPGGLIESDTIWFVTHVNYGPMPCPDAYSQIRREAVVITPDNGLLAVDEGGECASGGGSEVPPVINYGQPECLIVCHDVYYIPLQFPGPGIPEVTITSGCGPMTPCMNPIPCNPGNPWEYISTVYRVGGSWILRFEYSNPVNEPACYCAEITNITPLPNEAYALVMIRESPTRPGRQIDSFFDIWCVGRSPTTPLSGMVMVHSNPPGVIFDYPADSFFDLFTEWRRIPFHVQSGSLTPGQSVQLIAEIDYFGPGSDPFAGDVCMETAVVTDDHDLVAWDPVDPCVPIVPPMMNAGESQCFVVCHDIYDVLLNAPPGSGRPIINVVPGCEPPTGCTPPMPCVPGGPFDYVYYTEFDGINWHLIFEYSNELIEPVCYCVTYAGNLPSCNTHELVVLDEMMQMFDVSVMIESGELVCPPTDGTIQIFSIPSGAEIGPYPDSFFDIVAGQWHTVHASVAPGTFLPGETFQLAAHIQYVDPSYPQVWRMETVRVIPTVPPRLEIVHATECLDNVPPQMPMGESACFRVCHEVYHVGLAWSDPSTMPIVNITPGCFGPTQDQCPPDIACVPGGPFDYRWELLWNGVSWELEFEYSNPATEPVCYCVTVTVPVPPCETHQLAVLDEYMQTFDVSVKVTSPSGEPCQASGFINIHSQPPGAYIGLYISEFSGIGSEWHTLRVPVGRGAFPPGQPFELVASIEYTSPDYPDLSINEPVEVTSTGAIAVQSGGTYTVPPIMYFGDAYCFSVSKGTYYVRLGATQDQIPALRVSSGCPPYGPCSIPEYCTPGSENDYTVTVKYIGTQWYLIFTYGGAGQNVCYCVEYWATLIFPPHGEALGSVNETSANTYNVSVRSSSPFVPISGTVHVQSHPPGANIGPYPDSFFDIFTEVTIPIPVQPGDFMPGQTFQLVTDINFTDPALSPARYNEWAIVSPFGDLRVWDPVTPCSGDIVPPEMNVGQSECFVVCHGIYRVILNAPPGAGQPVLSIMPGCDPPPCTSPAQCVPGDPNDYVSRVFRDGANWILEFEYSNQFSQPVCYCVSYTGNLPPCTTHELVALDEQMQMFDVSVAVESPSMICETDGWVTAFSYPEGAVVMPGSILFENVTEAWHTVEFQVGPGSFPPGAMFELIARVDYTDPDYPTRWLVEHVLVTADDPPRLVIYDVGGECSDGSEIVPPELMPGQAACFRVCHRIYHVPIFWPYPGAPPISITPGCFGPEIDRCTPDPECLPGGQWDYRWSLVPGDVHWQLEFEYSNPNIEPVCFCVSVGMPPCDPVTDLVAYYDYSETSEPAFYLYWTAPQAGVYRIWSTTNPNHGPPPSPDWVIEAVLPLPPGPAQWIDPVPPGPLYKNYVIICDCGPQ